MKHTGRMLTAAIAISAMALSMLGGTATAKRSSAPLEGEGEGLKLVRNVEYKGGTDMEFVTRKGRHYAIAGSANGIGGAQAGALHIIDITKPQKAKEVATLNCSFYQNDIQISWNGRYAIMAQDGNAGPDACLASGQQGFMLVDIKNPKKPKPVGFAPTTGGSHNTTAHPTKPYVYNSNSDLAGNPQIQIFSIKNPKKPELVNSIPSVPHATHDISFNTEGDRAVTAAVSHFDIFNTEDPENPTLMFTGQCPGCSITHDAKFTNDGQNIVIGDEGGGGGTYVCPGGALYFYDFSSGVAPVLTGVYEPAEFVVPGGTRGQTAPGSCTSHVFDISDDDTKIAISWYAAGTRYLDISGQVGPTIGSNASPAGVQELGWFMPDGGSSWSSKFYRNTKWIYSNDIQRGFDVYKVTAK